MNVDIRPRPHYRTLFRDAFLINEKVNVQLSSSSKISKKKKKKPRSISAKTINTTCNDDVIPRR